MLQMKGTSRAGRRPTQSRSVGLIDDARGRVLATGTDGTVAAGSLRTLTQAGAGFRAKGAQAGGLIKVGRAYFTIRSADEDTVETTTEMTAAANQVWSLIAPIGTVDLTDTNRLLCMVRFHGAATGCSIQIEVEDEGWGQDHYLLGAAHALTGTTDQGAAFTVTHNGGHVRARVTSLTGVADPETDYVGLLVKGGPPSVMRG